MGKSFEYKGYEIRKDSREFCVIVETGMIVQERTLRAAKRAIDNLIFQEVS